MNKAAAIMVLALAAAACSDKSPTGTTPPDTTNTQPSLTLHELTMLGSGSVPERWTAEIASDGQYAYTTSWSYKNSVPGNAVKIWRVNANTPVLLDSLILTGAGTTSDVQISADGKYLVVSTESGLQNGIGIFDRSTHPEKPTLITRYSSANTSQGVHTVKLTSLNGHDYAFLAIDPSPAKLVITDITDKTNPTDVFVQQMGNPFIHDTFVRDGVLFTAEWDDGMRIWDIGGAGHGGTPSSPVALGSLRTVGGEVHNIWWFYGPNGQKKYAFIGQEGPASLFSRASGDIHVVDVSDFSAPREVAFYSVDSTTTSTGRMAGTHNFSMDENSSILYAAYYNGGVRALDVSGDLSACGPLERAPDGRCDLRLMKREVGRGLDNIGKPVFVWGVKWVNGRVYASDMINGIEIIDATALKK